MRVIIRSRLLLIKLEKEIAKLEKLARSEKQPRKKFELVQQLRKLEFELRRMASGKNN